MSPAPPRPAGYSGTPLAKKLGIGPGTRVVALHAPAHYRDLLEPLPDGVTFAAQLSAGERFVHLFVDRAVVLEAALPGILERLEPDGMLWVSWPKRASKLATDVTEDVVRELALAAGVVDVKVCAVDEVWSGLKLVYRLRDRPR